MKKFQSMQRATIRNAKRRPPRFERLPVTAKEWQAAVDAAEAILRIDGARRYGLIQGGPRANERRCLEILELGRRRGCRPAENALELYVAEWNAQCADKQLSFHA